MTRASKSLAALPAFIGLVIGSGLLNAQTTTTTTTTTPPTCTTAPASITALSIERVLTLSNVLTTLTPNVSPAILASVTSGAQEIRDRIIYNPQQGTVTDTTFLVAPGSPNPTPLGIDVTQSTLQSFVLSVSQIYTSCKPTPGILIVGTIGSASSPYANLNGALAAVSIGYTTDATPKINNVVEVVAGQVVAYSASALGTLTFPVSTVVPPGSNPGAPVINFPFTPPASGSIQVNQSPFFLDASSSTDPNKLPLTFTFTSDKPANFIPGPTPGATQIYFGSGSGDYTITITATNSAGQSTSTKVILTYINK